MLSIYWLEFQQKIVFAFSFSLQLFGARGESVKASICFGMDGSLCCFEGGVCIIKLVWVGEYYAHARINSFTFLNQIQ